MNELKNLVVQGLEANGVLSQLRAQIRSSVFKVVFGLVDNRPTGFEPTEFISLGEPRLPETARDAPGTTGTGSYLRVSSLLQNGLHTQRLQERGQHQRLQYLYQTSKGKNSPKK